MRHFNTFRLSVTYL